MRPVPSEDASLACCALLVAVGSWLRDRFVAAQREVEYADLQRRHEQCLTDMHQLQLSVASLRADLDASHVTRSELQNECAYKVRGRLGWVAGVWGSPIIRGVMGIGAPD